MKLHLQINWFLIMFLGISSNQTLTQNSEHLDKKQTFCGGHLTKAMSQFCISVPTPNHRVKRAISNECCKHPCSLKYLLLHYCQEVNRTAIEFHIKQQTDMQNRIPKVNFTRQPDPMEQQINSPLFHTKRKKLRRNHGKARGKRNCICNKRKIENARERNAISKRKVKIPRPQAKIGIIESDSRPFYVPSHK